MQANRLSGIALLLRIRGINHDYDNRIHAELREVEQRLRDNRPALTALELDAIKLRTMASATRRSQSLFAKKKGTFMKSRARRSDGPRARRFHERHGRDPRRLRDVQQRQRKLRPVPPNPTHEHRWKPARAQGSGGNEATHTARRAVANSPAETQAVRQVASTSSGSLPFTGFLAIPVLIIGVGLLGAGVAMRLRLRSGNDAGVGLRYKFVRWGGGPLWPASSIAGGLCRSCFESLPGSSVRAG